MKSYPQFQSFAWPVPDLKMLDSVKEVKSGRGNLAGVSVIVNG